MIEKLIIVGNGFDLSRGLNTSYNSFFAWLDTRNGVSIMNDTLQGFKAENFNAILQKDNIIVDNFWYTYMKLLELDDPEWNNVESVMLNALNPISTNFENMIMKNQPFQNIESYMKKWTPSEKKFSLLVSNLYLQNKQFDIYDYLFQELRKFENSFKEYLDSDTFRSSEQQFIRVGQPSWLDGTETKNISVLNFNYTYFLNDIPETQIRNIHGVDTSDPTSQFIFGIDSTKISPSQEIYRFTKASRIMMNSYDTEYNSILSHTITNISFIGHSLAEADYSYFQSIFDYLSIYDSDVTLSFYYTKYHIQHSEKMLKYQNAIQELINRYGRTLDNQDHGDNLYTKLILENRIKIIKSGL